MKDELFKFFTIDELCETNTGLPNEPTEKEKENLSHLIIEVLDPVRTVYGSQITVNSGFRSVEVNKAVKGALNSQHKQGQAADITTGSKDGNKQVYKIIKSLGKYDQLINEHDYKWVHVSYTNGFNRKQELAIK